jgi:hypothetical protein
MYKEAFEAAIEVIKAHPLIDINELVINQPATPELIDTFEMIVNIRLPEKIKAFYLFANGVKCKWSIKQNLSPDILDRIKIEGEQQDYDYSGPLGSVNILPIQDMIMDKYWKTPYQQAPEADDEIEFNKQGYKLGVFAKKLKVFDAYHLDKDEECIALFISDPVSMENFSLLLLDNYMADWRHSNIIDFETYILSICKAGFTIPSRKRLFAKKSGDAAIIINRESIIDNELAPALFR